MKPLSNLDLLDLWERGSDLHPIDRGLLALNAALPGEPYSALAEWPLGQRNAALAALRHACFGPVFEGWIACPECKEHLEFSLDTENFRQAAPGADTRIEIGGRIFRLPNSRDLAAIAGDHDVETAALSLLRQCCLEGGDVSLNDLDNVGDRLATADPLAESLIELTCAGCGHRWEEPLDISAWLWAEIDARAHHLLAEVHTLATAYGWSEQQILSLSAQRRALYLEMVQA
ncbi:MAG: hypothetical protein ACRD3F_14160 [Acidobacteriaceae bacterium]